MLVGYVSAEGEAPQLTAGLEDAGLVAQAQQGRTEAYNQLVLRHQSHCFNLACHLLGDRDAAADVTQDSFLKAYQRLHQYRGGVFRAWLLRIVINTCYDSLRRRRHETRVVPMERETGESEPEDWDLAWRDQGEGPEAYVLRRELAGRLQRAINRLPEGQRTVLVLCDVEGYDYAEIAQVTGLPLGTVKSRLARARLAVRDSLRAPGAG